jgi:hypothetical protein
MLRATGSRSVVSKDAVLDDLCDPQVEIMGDLKGKFEQVKLLNLNLIDQVLFPQMSIDLLWSVALDDLGGM